MRIAAFLAPVILGGCASGTILGPESDSISGVSYLSAPAGVLLRINPLHSRTQPKELARLKDSGLWLSKGWYVVDFDCSTLKKNGEVVAISMPEYNTTRNINIMSNRSYRLSCAPGVMDVLHLEALGAAPNYAIKVTAE